MVATDFDPVALEHFELTSEPIPSEVLGGESLEVWAPRLTGGTVRQVLTTDPDRLTTTREYVSLYPSTCWATWPAHSPRYTRGNAALLSSVRHAEGHLLSDEKSQDVLLQGRKRMMGLEPTTFCMANRRIAARVKQFRSG